MANKKIAVKEIAAEETAAKEKLQEIQTLLKDLDCDLRLLTKKIDALCHNPLRPGPGNGPKQPPPE